jgi:REP element-mobilizing transposase RayT
MARPPRIDLPDGLYHVTSRGNGRAAIFGTDDDRQRFLVQLADNVQTAAVVLYAYVLLDNHFHLLVRTPRANLSRFMQRLITSYALYARYGRTQGVARRRYRAYVHACLLDDDQPILSAMSASRYAVGDETFLEQTERLLAGRRACRAQDADLALPKPCVAASRIDTHVAADFHVAREQLHMHGHRGGLAKFAAVELACRLTGLTQRDVGQRYGNITSAAVSIIRRKVRSGQYPLSAVLERLQKKILHHAELQT